MFCCDIWSVVHVGIYGLHVGDSWCENTSYKCTCGYHVLIVVKFRFRGEEMESGAMRLYTVYPDQLYPDERG